MLKVIDVLFKVFFMVNIESILILIFSNFFFWYMLIICNYLFVFMLLFFVLLNKVFVIIVDKLFVLVWERCFNIFSSMLCWLLFRRVLIIEVKFSRLIFLLGLGLFSISFVSLGEGFFNKMVL